MSDWNTRWQDFQKSAEHCYPFLRPEDLIHASHISLQNKYLYVETPKVACSTIKKLLIDAEYEGRVPFSEMEYIHYREFSPLLNARQVGDFRDFLGRKDIFKFCFVRNPYSRLLSCYLDKIAKRKGQHYWPQIELGYGSFYDKALTFVEFVEAVCAQPIRHMDPHWRIQYYATFQAGIDYDYIGRFENFEADLKFAIGQTKIDFEKYYQIKAGHATGAKGLLNEFYTEEISEKVYWKYQKDFEYFGYDKNILKNN
jgi:dermatan 4-sulfotransferase 1